MRNPGQRRFAVEETPGARGARDWLDRNSEESFDSPFDDAYWRRMESHPDYRPEIDPSSLSTVPYQTGYQGVDFAGWHPGLEAQDEREIEHERQQRQRRQPLTQQFPDDDEDDSQQVSTPRRRDENFEEYMNRRQRERGQSTREINRDHPRPGSQRRDAPNWVGQDEHDALRGAGFRYVPEGGATSGNFYYRDHQHNPTEGYHISPPNQSRPYWRAEHGPADHNGRNSQGLSIGMSGDVNSVIASAETHERRSRAMRAHMPDSDLVHGVPADTYSLALAQDRMANRTDNRRIDNPDQFNHWQRRMREQIAAADRETGRERHPSPYEANRREDNIINLTSHDFPHVSPVDTYDAFNNDHWRYDPVGHSAEDPGPIFKKRVNGVDHQISPTHLGDWSYTARRPDGRHWSASFSSHPEAREYAEDMMNRIQPEPGHSREAAAKTPGQKMPMPGGDDASWLDDMINESLSTGRHPEHCNEVAYHGVDDLSGLNDEYQHRENEGGYYPQPSRHVPRDGHATICADCAAYHANGEGDPEHEHRYEHGMQAAMATLHHPSNLTFNDNDDEGNRIKPEDDQCFICGQQVDPDTETFHSPYGAPGFNMHIFRPGERGYTPPNPPRTAATNPGLNVKRQKSQVPKHRNLQSVDTAQGEANEAASHRGHPGQHRTLGIKTIKRRRAPKGQVAYVQGGDLGSVASLITEDSLTYVTNAQMGYPELGIPPASGMQAQQNPLAELQRDRMQNPQPGAPQAMPADSVDAVRPAGVGIPQVPGNMSGRTASVREGLEAQGWEAHEHPSGAVSHYTKTIGDKLHMLIPDSDGYWIHNSGPAGQEPNEYGEYEHMGETPVGYSNLRDALMTVHNMSSLPMTVRDSRPDVQKYNSISELPEYGVEDWPAGEDRPTPPGMFTAWHPGGPQDDSGQNAWRKLYDQNVWPPEHDAEGNDYRQPGSFMEVKEGGEPGPAREGAQYGHHFMWSDYAPGENNEELFPYPDWMRRKSNMDSTRILNDVHSGDNPQTLWRPYTDSIDGKYDTERENVEEGPPVANGSSTPSVSSENGAEARMSDGAQSYWDRQRRAGAMQALATWKSGAWGSDFIDQANPKPHERTIGWSHPAYDRLSDDIDEWREDQRAGGRPSNVDADTARTFPAGVIPYFYTPHPRDAWPEESARFPSKADQETGVVQPMVGFGRDSLTGEQATISSSPDSIKNDAYTFSHHPDGRPCETCFNEGREPVNNLEREHESLFGDKTHHDYAMTYDHMMRGVPKHDYKPME